MSGIINSAGAKSGIIGTGFGGAKVNTTAHAENNFNYVKFENGLLICWADYIASRGDADVTWTFPHAFKSGTYPTCTGLSYDAVARNIQSGFSAQITATSWTFVAVGHATAVSGGWYTITAPEAFFSSTNHTMTAIGRWK